MELWTLYVDSRGRSQPDILYLKKMTQEQAIQIMGIVVKNDGKACIEAWPGANRKGPLTFFGWGAGSVGFVTLQKG